MIYYLQVIKDNVSILLDSDISYYKHLKLGDVISVKYDIKTLSITKINNDNFNINDPIFITDWDSIKSKKLSISSLISEKYINDVTEMVKRDEKLILLGI